MELDVGFPFYKDFPKPGLEVIKLEFKFRLKKALSLAACGHVSASSQSLRFFITQGQDSDDKTDQDFGDCFWSLLA